MPFDFLSLAPLCRLENESFYSHDRKGTSHRCLKSLGSVGTHRANGMADPIAHFQEEVDRLNAARKEDVSDITLKV